jgi:hypothetical protein
VPVAQALGVRVPPPALVRSLEDLRRSCEWE